MSDLKRFFKRHHIEVEDILYIYRRDRKSVVCTRSGGENLPPLSFLKNAVFRRYARCVLRDRQESDHTLLSATAGILRLCAGAGVRKKNCHLLR